MWFYLFMQFPRIDEIEDLHHDKCVEDEGEMPGICPCCLEDSLIVVAATDSVESSTSNCPSHYSIVPFIFRVVIEYSAVQRICILRDKRISVKDEDQHNQ